MFLLPLLAWTAHAEKQAFSPPFQGLRGRGVWTPQKNQCLSCTKNTLHQNHATMTLYQTLLFQEPHLKTQNLVVWSLPIFQSFEASFQVTASVISGWPYTPPKARKPAIRWVKRDHGCFFFLFSFNVFFIPGMVCYGVWISITFVKPTGFDAGFPSDFVLLIV